MFGTVYHRLMITLHLQRLGVLLMVLILLRPLNVALIEFLVVLYGAVFDCFYVLSFLAYFIRTLSLLVFFLGLVSGLFSVHYMVPFSPFPFMFLFVFVFYHVTV